MKVAILAGGMGTRLSEETILKPKPMVEIGGKPILWHIMKLYSHYGYNEFVIALGYKGDVIRDYFLNYACRNSNLVTVNLADGTLENCVSRENWKVHLLETGEKTTVSGRIRQILDFTQETTLVTYGDGVANINIDELVKFHDSHIGAVTLTAVEAPGKFGYLAFDEDGKRIKNFQEKAPYHTTYINGGFYVIDSYLQQLKAFSDDQIFERDCLPELIHGEDLFAYTHKGFWQCMDTMREKQLLNEMWESGNAEWKVWND